eukprot:14889872-Alexandrium_andersonii.AAC.1
MASTLEGAVQSAMDHCNQLAGTIESCLIDVDAKMANNDLDGIIDLPQKDVLVTSLKALNGATGGGLKHFDKILEGLSNEVDTSKYTQWRAKAVTARQKGRLLMVCRSAAHVLKRSRASDIPGVRAEAKNLKVKLPASLNTRLVELEKAQAAQAQ